MIKIYLDEADQINLTSISKNAATKPEWLRVKAPQFERIGNTANLLSDLKLNTVCQKQAVQILENVLQVGLRLF